MHGSADYPGIVPLALMAIFEKINDASSSVDFLLQMAYFEIYNEEVNDLLVTKPGTGKNLRVIDHPQEGPIVEGLTRKVVKAPEDALELLVRGNHMRRVGVTNMNAYSSRSHAILQLTVESKPKVGAGHVSHALLNLIDLAGSERSKVAGTSAERLKEGININRSLLTLGTVISKLSERAKIRWQVAASAHMGGAKPGFRSVVAQAHGLMKSASQAHIPFRDSKLTRLLSPSLGGNSRTCVICNISSLAQNKSETLGTLRFAGRAKRVVNKVKRNTIAEKECYNYNLPKGDFVSSKSSVGAQG